MEAQRRFDLRLRLSRVLSRLMIEGGADLRRPPVMGPLLSEEISLLARACLHRGDERIALVCPQEAQGCDGCPARGEGVGEVLRVPVVGGEEEPWELALARGGEWTAELREVADEVAATLGHALVLRSRLSRQFGELAADFDALVDATREISRCEDLEDLYEVVAEMGHRLLNLKPHHFLCLERYSAFDKELTIVAASGEGAQRFHGLKLSTDLEVITRKYYPRYEDGRLARDLARQEELPLTGTLLVQGRGYVLVHDVERRDPSEGYYDLQSSTRSEIAVPIILADGSPWGVLNVESPSPNNFSPVFDLPILQSFARVVAVFVQALVSRDRHRSLDEMVNLPEGLKRVIHISAQSVEPVLITGETGTGKEVVARLLHYTGPRRKAALVPVNCGALEQSLLMNELFGHAAFSYTGAGARDKGGLFHAADGGTIFLDEIENMPAAVQEAVLRVVERGEVRRVGGTDLEQVDVRILAATNVDLKQLIEDGSFRRDLYYRLKILEITLPPLRERRDSIPRLVEQFVGELRRPLTEVRVDPEVIDALMRYDWPGNVRELKNAVKRMLVFSNHLTVDLLPDDVRRAVAPAEASAAQVSNVAGAAPAPAPAEAGEAGQVVLRVDRTSTGLMEAAERALLVEALRVTGGDRYAAAHLLGISPPTVYRRIKQLGIQASVSFR